MTDLEIIEQLRRALAATTHELDEAKVEARDQGRVNAQAQLRIVKLEGWLKDSSDEASKLQAELAAARAAIGELTRRLDQTERDFTDAVGALDQCRFGSVERAG